MSYVCFAFLNTLRLPPFPPMTRAPNSPNEEEQSGALGKKPVACLAFARPPPSERRPRREFLELRPAVATRMPPEGQIIASNCAHPPPTVRCVAILAFFQVSACQRRDNARARRAQEAWPVVRLRPSDGRPNRLSWSDCETAIMRSVPLISEKKVGSGSACPAGRG